MQIHFERAVPHQPEQMFSLVADLRSYPSFIPHCTAMEVWDDHGARHARMTIRFGPITQSYTSRVTLDRLNCRIRAEAMDGPFSHLDSTWHFARTAEGTDIRFDIDFRISNPIIRAVAEPAFAAAQRQIIDAFVRRADELYGARV